MSTLVELMGPFDVDDNLAIPVSSALALTFANLRLRTELAEFLFLSQNRTTGVSVPAVTLAHDSS